MQPFKIAISDTALADLKSRLARRPLPDELEGVGWDYGTNVEWLKGFVDYWAREYDWRAAEARLNGFAQFTTTIDGETVHFVHVRGKGANPHAGAAHQWLAEQFRRAAAAGRSADGRDRRRFLRRDHPLAPGYGFSGRPTQRGMNLTQIGHLWAKLMEQLGYSAFSRRGPTSAAAPCWGWCATIRSG